MLCTCPCSASDLNGLNQKEAGLSAYYNTIPVNSINLNRQFTRWGHLGLNLVIKVKSDNKGTGSGTLGKNPVKL